MIVEIIFRLFGEWGINLKSKENRKANRTVPLTHSISYKMTILIVAVMLLSVIFAGVFGSLFLEKYYTKQKQSAVKKVYETFDDVVKTDAAINESTDLIKLNSILEKTGASAIVIDNSGTVLYTYGSEVPLRQRWRDLVFGFGDNKMFKSTVVEKNDNYSLLYTVDSNNNNYHYELVSSLSNDSDLVVRLSVENFKESLSITNHFYAGLAIALIIVITILMIILTRKYTIPMLQLAAISKKMSELDFDVKYEGHHNDELGILGDSMNEMSEKLESTITELKTANLELEKDIKQKEEVDELRKEFISNVSHELKTPIALIQGYAEGLSDGINDNPEDTKYYSDVIVDESNKLNKMVQKLMTLNQIEFGSVNLNIERFDIVEVINTLISRRQILSEKDNIKIEVVAPDKQFVWGDEFYIEEVITNYLNNAVNHVDDKHIIKVQVTENNGIVRVSVFNSGKPIPEDELEKIWVKFYKVDKARTREYGGSGIGLSIVKAIMDNHDKECGVINHTDGVEFWFELDANN